MATVTEKTQQGYADADEFIQYQIEQARSRIKATDLLTASVLAGLLLVGYLLTFTLLDHWVIDGGFNPATRAGMLVAVVVLCGAIVFRYVLRPWFRTIHPLYAARMLDRSSEGLEGSLMTLVDLQAGGRKNDSPIQRSLEKRAAVKLAEVHVDEAIDRRLLIRLGTALFAVTLAMCLYAVFSPKAISLLRPLTLAQAEVATRTVVESVQPGNKKVPAGSQVEFIADVSGVIPADVQVLFTTADRRFVDEPLKMRTTDDQNRFQVLMTGESDRGIRQDFQYRVVAGDATSETFTISVDQPPTAHVTEVRYQYPAYMNLPERTDTSGTIEAWEDSTVTILAETNVSVESATLQFSDNAAFTVRGEELPMSVQNTSLSGELKLKSREDGSLPKFYRIMVTDADGNSDPEPVVYAMDIRRDQPPVVKLVDPNRDLQVASNAIIPLLIEAEDPDFLLRSVTLHYSINGKPVQPSEVLLDTSKTTLPKRWAESWDFRLSALKLNPGDVVTYHVQARDNRPPLGNQSRTGDLNLQVTPPISDQAVQEQLAEDREMQTQQLKDRQPAPEASGDPSAPQSDIPPQPQSDAAENPAGDESGPVSGDPDGKAAESKPSESPQNANSPDKQPANGSETDPTAEGNPSGQPQPGTKTNPTPSGTRRADDDVALQKLIDQMNEKGNQDSSDSGPQSGQADAKQSPKGSDSKQDETGNPDESPNSPKTSPESDISEKDPQKSPESNSPEKNSKPADEKGSDMTKPPADPTKATEGPAEKPESDNANSSNEQAAKDEAGNPGKEEKSSAAGNESPDSKGSPEDSSDTTSGTDGSKGNDSAKPTENKAGQPEPQADASKENQKSSSPDGKSSPEMNSNQDTKSAPSKQASEQSGSKTEESADSKDAASKQGEGANDGQSSKPPNDSGDSKGNSQKTEGNPSEPAKPSQAKPDENSAEQPEDTQAAEDMKNDAKSGDAKSGDGKSGDGKSGDGKSGDGKSGDGKSGDGKSSDGKSGDGKSGDGKSGEGKSAEGKSGEGKSAEGKSGDGKSGDGKSGDGKSGDGKSGDGKSGDGKSGEGKSGEGKSGEGKSGEGKSGEGKSGQGKSGGKGSGKGKAGFGKSGTGTAGGQGESGDASEITDGGAGGSGSGEIPSDSPSDPSVDKAAQAANLALRRLQKELERDEVDPKLLEELGYTKEELAAFKDRMLRQLEERQLNEQQQKERSLSQKSFEEMLRSLDVQSTGKAREGRSNRDRDQQDTTSRQTAPPGQWSERFRQYQRSMSGMNQDSGRK